jgi:hypothetical protein
MSDSIQITVNGIVKVLKKYDYKQAIAEYIWNGFDATATRVDLNYEANPLGFITKMEVRDNGYGIIHGRLPEKFKPFFDSEKAIEIDSPKNTSAVHGKNGVGRLTFFKFCSEANWHTVYKEGRKKYQYGIKIKVQSLNKYDSPTNSLKEVTDKKVKPGTVVRFINVFPEVTEPMLSQDLFEFLCLEFGWYLELNKANGYQLIINGQELDYSGLIGDHEVFILKDEETKDEFEIRYIRWSERINREYSKFYYIGSDEKERYKEFTLLNNKGDHFFHSVFIKSKYFDHFAFKSATENTQICLIGSTRNDMVFRRLYKNLANYLRDKRKPFLRQYTERLIREYEQEGVFPEFGSNSWDKYQKAELENVVRGLYEVQPKIFVNLNIEQKKTFVRLLNLVLDSDERDKLFDILGEVVELTTEEREQMVDILKVTRLSRINQTIRLIEDRYKTIAQLKELVINPTLNANEVDHLQKMIESHYWIFGEQYHLVTAAEQKFEEALRRHTYLLRGEKKNKRIDHEDKNKEMDIFLCRQDILTDEIKNVVVELKHPLIKLGEKELTQVKTYMNVILNEPEFNGNNMTWEFFLIGNDFNKKKEIEAALENARPHGEKSLVFKSGQFRIYIKKWSEVFNDFEMKHKFINEKLKLERKTLEGDNLGSATKVVEMAIVNSAAMSATLIPQEEDIF